MLWLAQAICFLVFCLASFQRNPEYQRLRVRLPRPFAPMAGHFVLLLLAAPSAALGSACPGDSDSDWKAQASFSWAGSASAYGGSSTLEADAAPLKPIGEHTARIPEASDARGNLLFMADGQDCGLAGRPPSQILRGKKYDDHDQDVA